MEPDHANITQITGWLHSAERWSELADFLLHTSINSSRDPARTLALLGQCRAHVDDSDVDAELAQCQIFNQMAAADWEPYVMTCLEEMGRDDPHYAGWANLMLSMLVVGVDVDHARTLITSTISPRSPGTHLAMYLLAARLGIGDEVHELRRAERADGSSQNLDLPKQTLRAELERRNWLD